MLDTQRAGDLGCYGSAIVRSPNIDALGERSTRFTRAFPESLPTIPVRRAVYTGRRAYPFRNYRHLKWGTVKLPGRQPIAEEEDTLAENLSDPGYGGPARFTSCYGPADRDSEAEVADMRAHYCGLVTHVDRWVGVLLEDLDRLGLSERTTVMLVSDHGTNFCDNPRNVIGKPANSMYPGLMRLPLLIRLPGERCAGHVCDELVYNTDLTATACDLAGIDPPPDLAGRSLLPLLDGEKGTPAWKRRDYVTCRYRDSLCYVDDTCWALGDIDGNMQEVFDLESDPDCRAPLPAEEAASLWQRAWQRLRDDAGGDFPDYRDQSTTDALERC